MIPSQPIFSLPLNAKSLAEKQQNKFDCLWFEPTGTWIHSLPQVNTLTITSSEYVNHYIIDVVRIKQSRKYFYDISYTKEL
jgi:hypothetical protein